MMKTLDTDRWLKRENFDKKWLSRSKHMLDMFERSKHESEKPIKLAEFGSGPYAPFSSICSKNDSYCVKKFDLKKWDDETHVIDLNFENFPEERFDVCAFSGVLEYINDVQAVLQASLNVSDFCLISYAFFPNSGVMSDSDIIGMVKKRSLVNGWRTHYKLSDIISIVSKVGIIVDLEIWTDQVLIFVKSKLNL